MVCRTFLLLNGLDLTADRVKRYTTFLSLAAGSLTEGELAAWLSAHTKPAE